MKQNVILITTEITTEDVVINYFTNCKKVGNRIIIPKSIYSIEYVTCLLRENVNKDAVVMEIY